ncbi:exodeoxyribonuclease V subunit gamma, partial [Chlamydiota bacterium]
GLTVHLFGFSHISPLYFHFFRQAGRHIPVYLYQLSACQEFWSDISSEHSSLLGPLGKTGRAMARLIEESETPTEENYLFFGGEEQLKQIQRDLLTLQPTQSLSDDPSIQVHSASTRREEVVNLHSLLLELNGIEPRDIIVMAPNIALYAPYIEAVFGKYLDYQIADMPSQKGLPIIEGLFLLLGLEKRRWSAPAVLELFEHPLFRKKWNFSDEDLEQIRVWVRQTGIRWGVDGPHRVSLLQRESGERVPVESAATWMDGLGHLIEELAIPYAPSRIDFTQAETLGKTVELLSSLYKEMRELEAEKPLSEWAQFFKRIAETYFVCGEESEPLFALLEKLEKGGRLFANTLYRYPFVFALLQECAGAVSVTVNRNQLQAVRFCSMLPMRAIPAKVICLLGMNHDAFPRKDRLQALDLLGRHPKCGYSPSRLDFDRSLFLEAILSAREKLIISYLGRDPLDLSEWPPSSVVAHLLPLISKNRIFNHQTLDLASIAPPTSFKIGVEKSPLPQGEYEITVTDLLRLSRSFLGHYLRAQGLRVGEEKTIQDEETFLLTPARRALLRARALKGESILSRVEREGDFPIGPFGKLARLQIQEEMATLPKQALTQVVLEPFTLSINPSLKVTFTGVIDGVYAEGLCVQGKKDFRTALKAWPLFLLLNAYDSSKSELLFAASDEMRSRCFEDPLPHLREWVELFFYAQAHPFLLAIEWIEPILKQEPKKLGQMEHYDQILEWYLRGKGKIDPAKWIEAYYPIVDKVYGAMAHAWF